MKTREEIDAEWRRRCEHAGDDYGNAIRAAENWRDAALAELEDPLARLLSAAKVALRSHEPCVCSDALRDAIDFAEQHREQAK